MINKLQEKRGSEVIQTLIVIAVMGAIAVTVLWNIGDNFEASAESVTTRVDTLIEESNKDM